MVSHNVLALVAALSVHGNVAQEISEAQARQIALSFAQFVNSDQYGASIVEDFVGRVEFTRRAGGTWGISGDKYHVSVNQSNGRVQFYEASAPPHIQWAPVSNPRFLIDDALCLSIAQAVYRRAGFSETLVLDQRIDLQPEFGFYGIEARFVRMAGDVEIDASLDVMFGYHATSGQVLEMRVMPDPILPPVLTPRISLQDARRIVMGAVARYATHLILSESEWRPLRLRAVLPFDTDYLYEDFPFDRRAYEREWRTILAYDVALEEESQPPYFFSGRKPSWRVIVDAITGKLLAVAPPGRSIGASRKKPVPFGWDLGPGPLTITLGGKTYELSSADVLKVQQGSPNEPGVPVLLQRARLILNALYYPKANLLSVGEGKLRSFGRPDEELKKALLALAAKE
ncbi:MAG: hypothetical protein AMXMBFR19_07290 [Chthonomonadaceae bacterium]|uniref:Uncharacterized protein n=1 Tax=Candidatus Nitrosymbiomonas proteolyticus TaxID=2608984 RepID=A0A809R9T3_9BACT|nr:conserved hypothetical protein [Candidatus Nitrosymbiomonas proteolyticus]